MSILITSEVSNDIKLQRRAEQIIDAPRKLAEQMVVTWSASFDALWAEGPLFTPAEKLAALGTNAAELFDINTQFVTFMLTQLTGRRDDLVSKIQSKVATIPAYTAHADGTVTLDTKPKT